MTPTLWLALLFLLTIGHLLTLKICSTRLDHRTAPMFISGWTLFGVLLVFPLYDTLIQEGLNKISGAPYLAVLCLGKAWLLYFLLLISQRLMKESLSSRHYVTPMALGCIAVVNFILGEHLTAQQWFIAAGLFSAATTFFFKGHLSQLSKQGRLDYFKLVGLSTVIAALDHTLTKDVNWITLLLVSNLALFGLALVQSRADTALLKSALLNKAAVFAGLSYAATELVKFYQQVTINPVSVVVMTQAMTKPVILMLSALIWNERTVKEQAVWGGLAFALVALSFVL